MRTTLVSEREDRRRNRLRDELLDEARIGHLGDIELEEVAYADRPPIHEGKLPPFGAIVAPVDHAGSSFANVFGSVNRVGTADEPESLRRYADGYSTFLIREGDSPPWIASLDLLGHSENKLASIAEATGATVVRRTAGGQVSIVLPGRVAWRSGGGWTWKPSATAYVPGVADHTPRRNQAIVEPLLELCVHELSPLGVGATFVWVLKEGGLDGADDLDNRHASTPIALNVADPAHHTAICSAAAQIDRAILVDPDGTITSLGVTLRPSVADYEPTERGTRHDSAAAFSAVYRFVLVFVVSSDGPVTVFKEGRAIVSTRSARRRLDEDEICDCVQFDGDETPDERWEYADRLADPECLLCGGGGTQRVEFEVEESLDDVL